MARFQCAACKGEYQDPLPDGTRYFHACPPIANPAHADLEKQLADLAAGGGDAADPAEVQKIRRQLARTLEFVERPGHRDENIVQGADRKVSMKSEGAGRVELAE